MIDSSNNTEAPSVSKVSITAHDDALLAKSAQGAKLLIILQIGSRALTFTVNQFLLRFLSPALLGISTQLEVFSMTCLFFAREALRNAILRQTDEPEPETTKDARSISQDEKLREQERKHRAVVKTQTVVNLAYISILMGATFTLGLQSLWLRSVPNTILSTPYFTESLYIYSGSALLELMFEPSFVVVQQKSKYGVRAAADLIATLSRCFVTCATAMYAHRNGIDIGVLPFALGQLSFAVSMLFVYVSNVWPLSAMSGFSMLPRTIVATPPFILSYFSPSILSLATSLFLQGILKHLLTQGDVLLISYLASLQDQGIYALASNYGGLVARLLFQPIEESSRNYFAKALSGSSTTPSTADSDSKKTPDDNAPSTSKVHLASAHLQTLLRTYILLSVATLSIGPTLAPLLLNTLLGPVWASTGAGAVLGKYCYYIPLLALNGITESFISSVSSKTELNRQSAWMIGFSTAFALGGWLFLGVLGLGAEGLVWANCINMSCRILWGARFIRGFLGRFGCTIGVRSLLPNQVVLAAGVGTAGVLARMSNGFEGRLWDFVTVAPVVGCFLIILVIFERRFLKQIFEAITSR